MPDKSVRDELAELTGAVRELRDREVADTLRDLRAEVEKLRAERVAHQCSCTHVHWYQQTYPIPGCAPYVQPQIWYGTVTSGTSTASAVGSGYMSAGSTTMLSPSN